jgi:hypothetical protein
MRTIVVRGEGFSRTDPVNVQSEFGPSERADTVPVFQRTRRTSHPTPDIPRRRTGQVILTKPSIKKTGYVTRSVPPCPTAGAAGSTQHERPGGEKTHRRIMSVEENQQGLPEVRLRPRRPGDL